MRTKYLVQREQHGSNRAKGKYRSHRAVQAIPRFPQHKERKEHREGDRRRKMHDRKIARNPRSGHNDEHARRPDRPEQRNGRDGEEYKSGSGIVLKQDQRHGRQKNTEQKNRIFHPARIGPHGGNQLGPRQNGAYLGHFRYLQAQPPYVQPTPRSIDFASEQKSHGEQYQRAQICNPGDALEKMHRKKQAGQTCAQRYDDPCQLAPEILPDGLEKILRGRTIRGAVDGYQTDHYQDRPGKDREIIQIPIPDAHRTSLMKQRTRSGMVGPYGRNRGYYASSPGSLSADSPSASPLSSSSVSRDSLRTASTD